MRGDDGTRDGCCWYDDRGAVGRADDGCDDGGFADGSVLLPFVIAPVARDCLSIISSAPTFVDGMI